MPGFRVQEELGHSDACWPRRAWSVRQCGWDAITDASTARTAKALGYYFQTDMRDDSAVYDAISSKPHVDAEHIAREPVLPGIRLAAMQCVTGSAWRHHARCMCPPTLDQARRTQVHLCRLIVRVILAVPATAPIELAGVMRLLDC